MICNLCPRMCGAVRTEDAGNGLCGEGTLPVIARAALHFDEEPVISVPGCGSGAIFFSGCPLKCVFCQNYRVSHEGFGKRVSVERLREIYRELEDQGARNLNLVSGTHFIPAIAESLRGKKPDIPIIWNSSGYERPESLKALDGLADVYLPDFKYADAETAKKYSGAADYFEFAKKAIAEMLRQTGPVKLDEDDAIRKGTIIRHLILPGQVENSKRVLRYIRKHFEGAWVSLMAQYVPMGRASDYPEIDRPITQEEYDEVVEYMLDLGLEDGFVQELEAADSKYTPDFDLTGV